MTKQTTELKPGDEIVVALRRLFKRPTEVVATVKAVGSIFPSAPSWGETRPPSTVGVIYELPPRAGRPGGREVYVAAKATELWATP